MREHSEEGVVRLKPAKPEGDESDDSINWGMSSSSSESDDEALPGGKLHHTMFLKLVRTSI